MSALTPPREHFCDPAQFRRELEAIHFSMWLYAARADELPSVGSFVTRRFADAEVLLVRDEAGVLRAFHNVCRHRGTRLCHDEAGRVAGLIQCRYHAWTYRLDGRLEKAFHMEEVEGFRAEDFPLASVAVAEWGGFVFVCLSASPPPFAEHLAGLDVKFAAWQLDELVTVERRAYTLKANWKLVVANYHECLHCPVAHPQLNRLSHYLSGDNEPMQPTYMGARMELKPGVTTLSTSMSPPRSPLPGLNDEQRRHVYYYALLPNLLLNLHPDYGVAFRMNAAAVDRTEVVCEWLMHRDEVARPGFDASDAIDFWHQTNLQDWELSDLAQAGISSRGYRPGPYSNREDLLVAFDEWVLAKLVR
ncbi:MAG: aromatic ring-hydroxylating dioxygenase subunit alpha [Myxococcaceae bacterium]|nr:aromatic ring-hydroxylating dioxygenase subunit alpha [Myxococcaceae bacterium]